MRRDFSAVAMWPYAIELCNELVLAFSFSFCCSLLHLARLTRLPAHAHAPLMKMTYTCIDAPAAYTYTSGAGCVHGLVLTAVTNFESSPKAAEGRMLSITTEVRTKRPKADALL